MSQPIVATETAMTDGDADQFVMMRVGGQDIAFAIQDVRDAVEPHAITPIPLAPSAIAGVMNLRGRIVTVIDLRRILGGDSADDGGGREYFHMIGINVDRAEGLFTVLVDSVSDVRRIDRILLEPPPVTLDPALKHLCTGVFRLPERLVVLLDVDRILDPETILATPTIPFRPRRNAPMIESREQDRDVPVNPPAAPVDAGPALPQAPPSPGRAVEGLLVPEIIIAKRPSIMPVDKRTENAPKASAIPRPVAPAPAKRVDVPILDGIGGEAALSKLVAAFYEEIMADPSLADFFVEVDMSLQHGRMIATLGRLLATSGSIFATAEIGFDWLVPEKVMEDEHFNRCLAHFERVLDRQAVEKTIGERFLIAIEWCREGVVD